MCIKISWTNSSNNSRQRLRAAACIQAFHIRRCMDEAYVAQLAVSLLYTRTRGPFGMALLPPFHLLILLLISTLIHSPHHFSMIYVPLPQHHDLSSRADINFNPPSYLEEFINYQCDSWPKRGPRTLLMCSHHNYPHSSSHLTVKT